MSWKDDAKEISGVFLILLIICGTIIGIGYCVLKVGEVAIGKMDDNKYDSMDSKKETYYYKIVWNNENDLPTLLSKYKKGDQTISISVVCQVFDRPEKKVDYRLKLSTHEGKLFVMPVVPVNAYRDIGIFGNKVLNVVDVEDTTESNFMLLKVTTIPEYLKPQLYAVVEGNIWDGQRVYELMPIKEVWSDTNGTLSDPYVYRFTPEFFIDLQYDVIYIEGQGYILKNDANAVRLIPFESERSLWDDSDFTK